MKINKYLIYSLLLMGGLFVSCDDDQPSIDDYPLNYEIPQIGVTSDIPVGAYLYDNSGVYNDETRWKRLTDPFDDGPDLTQGGGRIGPYLMPTQGRYIFNRGDSATSLIYKNIVEWAKQARIDFLITPAVREHVNDPYPFNINAQDTTLLALISGRLDTLPYANRGEMKYAIMFDINNFATSGTGLSNNVLVETVEAHKFTYTPKYINPNTGLWANVPGMAARDTTVAREERLYNIFKRLSHYFKDETYFHVNGRPVLFLAAPDKLYTSDSKRIYDNIRDTVKVYSGKDVFLVARQSKWTPTARFYYFFVKGEVDAITQENLVNVGGGQWDQTYILNQLINEHMKANKKFISEQGLNIDYIPSASPSFSQYVIDGNYQYPLIRKNPDEFRKRCNVAKMNLGRNPMVLIDSFNYWQNESQIEPADPDYGYGYGTTYLDIVREEFKRN